MVSSDYVGDKIIAKINKEHYEDDRSLLHISTFVLDWLSINGKVNKINF
jgi:hypothetical protein